MRAYRPMLGRRSQSARCRSGQDSGRPYGTRPWPIGSQQPPASTAPRLAMREDLLNSARARAGAGPITLAVGDARRPDRATSARSRPGPRLAQERGARRDLRAGDLRLHGQRHHQATDDHLLGVRLVLDLGARRLRGLPPKAPDRLPDARRSGLPADRIGNGLFAQRRRKHLRNGGGGVRDPLLRSDQPLPRRGRVRRPALLHPLAERPGARLSDPRTLRGLGSGVGSRDCRNDVRVAAASAAGASPGDGARVRLARRRASSGARQRYLAERSHRRGRRGRRRAAAAICRHPIPTDRDDELCRGARVPGRRARLAASARRPAGRRRSRHLSRRELRDGGGSDRGAAHQRREASGKPSAPRPRACVGGARRRRQGVAAQYPPAANRGGRRDARVSARAIVQGLPTLLRCVGAGSQHAARDRRLAVRYRGRPPVDPSRTTGARTATRRAGARAGRVVPEQRARRHGPGDRRVRRATRFTPTRVLGRARHTVGAAFERARHRRVDRPSRGGHRRRHPRRRSA